MKKQDLIELGLTEEQAEKVLSATSEELKDYVPRTRLNEVIAERDKAREDVKERDKQLDSVKGLTQDNEELKGKIEKLQEANKAKEEAHQKALKSMKVDNEINKLVSNYKGKNEKAIRALLELDLDKAELLEDGSVKGLEDKFKLLSTDESTSFLFEKEEPNKFVGVTPTTSIKTTEGANKDLSKMSYEELSAYFAEGNEQ